MCSVTLSYYFMLTDVQLCVCVRFVLVHDIHTHAAAAEYDPNFLT